MNVIQIENLSVKYNQIKALSDITINVNEGEFLGIVGPNGGGKTTLIKTILGLIEPSSGSVTISENAVVGYVPQLSTFDRDFPITVGEVILTGHLPRKPKMFFRPSIEVREHVLEVMNILGIEELYDRQIGQLSGGQNQKVMIARALMNHPNVLILDEPTSGVDEESRGQIYEMLSKLNNNITIIIVSHNIAEITPYLDRVIYIDKKAHIHHEGYDIDDAQIDFNMCPIDWLAQRQQVEECLNCDDEMNGGQDD